VWTLGCLGMFELALVNAAVTATLIIAVLASGLRAQHPPHRFPVGCCKSASVDGDWGRERRLEASAILKPPNTLNTLNTLNTMQISIYSQAEVESANTQSSQAKEQEEAVGERKSPDK